MKEHPNTPDFPALAAKYRAFFSCDTARITAPGGEKMYLVLGTNKDTAKESSNAYWTDETGRRVDFEYVEEKCVASGATPGELHASAVHYKEPLTMTWPQYFRSLGINVPDSAWLQQACVS